MGGRVRRGPRSHVHGLQRNHHQDGEGHEAGAGVGHVRNEVQFDSVVVVIRMGTETRNIAELVYLINFQCTSRFYNEPCVYLEAESLNTEGQISNDAMIIQMLMDWQ